MKKINLFFVMLATITFTITHSCNAVGKDKTGERTFTERERTIVKKMQQIVAPKSKKQSASKIPLFTGAPMPKNKQPEKNALAASGIRKFLTGYKESNAEETFYAHYRGKEGSTLLMDVIKEGGESNDTRALLDLGAEVNAVDRNGNTALHRVIKGRPKERKKINYTLVTQLLQAGANPRARNKKDETPLSLAEERKATSIVKKMLGT